VDWAITSIVTASILREDREQASDSVGGGLEEWREAESGRRGPKATKTENTGELESPRQHGVQCLV